MKLKEGPVGVNSWNKSVTPPTGVESLSSTTVAMSPDALPKMFGEPLAVNPLKFDTTALLEAGLASVSRKSR
jgi:hypothetical protein